VCAEQPVPFQGLAGWCPGGVLGSGGWRPVRVFFSYAHGDAGHEELVRELWVFLRACGVDARLDLAAARDRVDWAPWMTREVRDADRVLDPAYRPSTASLAATRRLAFRNDGSRRLPDDPEGFQV